jgi:outer membrane protein assembly factor BamB
MSCSRSATFLAAWVLGLAAVGAARAGDDRGTAWAQWRGPTGQGYADDTRVPLTWGEKENILWQADLPGHGNSSPIVWGDRVFLTAATRDGGERYVLCLRARDGKLLWQQLAARDRAPGKIHAWNSYATPSCVTDGKHVYAFFGTPGLFCYDLDGKPVWKHAFGTFTSETNWGIGASPFLFEDLVIQNCDNDGAAALPPGAKPADAAPMALIALDKATGKERWRTPRNQGRGFSTPLLVPSPQGRPQLVLNGPRGVWAYDPRSGKELWHCERPRTDEMYLFGEPMPVFNKEAIFALSGRPGPFQAIRNGGSGDVTATHVLWQSRRKGSRDVASPILWGDLLYAADNGGLLACYDTRTGNMVYKDKQRLGAKALASPIALRGKLLFVLESGETLVVEPGRPGSSCRR